MDEVLMLLGVIAGATWLAYAAFAWNVGRRLKAADRSACPLGTFQENSPCSSPAETKPRPFPTF